MNTTAFQVRSLREVLRSDIGAKDVDSIFKEMETTAPRAAIITSAAVTDTFLGEVIYSHFVDLNKNEAKQIFELGPLGSLGAKIRIGYAMGLYGLTTRRDLELIRSLRNMCAHSIKAINFETDEIASECKKLSSFGAVVPEEVAKTLRLSEMSPIRAGFTLAVRMLLVGLIILARQHENERTRPSPRLP